MSVSLGSSKRDHDVELDLFGETFQVRRQGTDGDVRRAVALLRELDGRVDAFGLGGANMTLSAAGRTWWLANGKRFARACDKTPIVDGSGLKGAVEADAVRVMAEDLGLELAGKRVLVCSATERWGMAEGFRDAGCGVIAADLPFALGVGGPTRDHDRTVRRVRALAPVLARMPLAWRHPEQEREAVTKGKSRYSALYREADIIAGGYGQVIRWMPKDMAGKWVVTNTTTADDVRFLRDRGVELLVTTTPRLKGRSFGANVIEAMLVALEGTKRSAIAGRYLQLLRAIGFRPDVLWLQRDIADA